MFICICRSYICKGWVMAPYLLIYAYCLIVSSSLLCLCKIYIGYIMSEKDYSKFLVRLTPKVRALLDVAHEDLEMTRAQIVNNALKDYLKRYNNADINVRLNRLVK